MKREGEVIFTLGNDAMTAGAIAAGARFYAGYPITPSSEVAELSSIRLPVVGGIFVQMEDELGSIAAIIGASLSGKKAYTATSGPGFSLMQENLGVAVMGEVPCVIINVQRSGPSTGLATKPAQGDLMQAKWGTHGDHGIIVLSPASVQECYDLMILAFNFSEKYRTPVVFLADENVGHLREPYVRWEVTPADIVERKVPTCAPADYKPYEFDGQSDGIAPLPYYGSPYVFRINGSGHDESGAPCARADNADKFIRHYEEKFLNNIDDITRVNQFGMDDAEYAIVTFGCSTRAAKTAMKQARARDIKAGVLQIVTLWPFPEAVVHEVGKRVKGIVVPELNLGQLRGEVRKCVPSDIPVLGVNKVNSEILFPAEVLAGLEEVSR